jgi:hypothetical protein
MSTKKQSAASDVSMGKRQKRVSDETAESAPMLDAVTTRSVGNERGSWRLAAWRHD